MALKDLVEDRDKIIENAIEALIRNYVRYDPKNKAIIFTLSGSELGNERKILVYLAAILGWKYVLAEQIEVPTKPADLEGVLGISGGSLRPALKKLKDGHLLSCVNGHYAVQISKLGAVTDMLSGEKIKTFSSRRKPTKKVSKSEKPKKAKGDVRKLLDKWLADGYFNKPRTLADLLNRYHEKGIIVKQTSLSGPYLRAVQHGLLSRSKKESDGKTVWAYRKASK